MELKGFCDIAACKEAGVPLGCILQTRFSTLYEEAKAKVESGELGKMEEIPIFDCHCPATGNGS